VRLVLIKKNSSKLKFKEGNFSKLLSDVETAFVFENLYYSNALFDVQSSPNSVCILFHQHRRTYFVKIIIHSVPLLPIAQKCISIIDEIAIIS